MRYRLFLDNCVIGKNQIVLPFEIGEYLKESATVYIDDNPVYTEIVIPDGIVGSFWDETLSPSMERVGTGVDYLLTFEAPYACQYIDVGEGNGVGESFTTTTNTDCNVMGWWVVDELGWWRSSIRKLALNIGGQVHYVEKVFLNEGGILKQCNVLMNEGGVVKYVLFN